MRMSTVSKNILTIAVAALALAAFIVLAEGVGGKSDAQKRLDALQSTNTTTTEVVEDTTTTSTTTFVIETTTSLIPPVTVTTSAPPTTPTTKKATTATTKKPSTPKTTTTTTTVQGPTGQVDEKSEGSPGSFVRNSDGSYTGAAASACSASDPFCFHFGSEAKSDPSRITIFAQLKNNTSKTITFPGGINISFVLHRPDGSSETITLADAGTTDIGPGVALKASATTTFPGTGQYTFDSGTCRVDYGS